ncbi:hypothetical protein [Sphingobacterium hungaricum]
MLFEGDITTLIPQRQPMVMVDSIVEYSEKQVISSFTLVEGNLFIQNNQFLESGLIEHMAQSVALHTGYFYFLKNETPPTGYIGTVQSLDIFHLPKLHSSLRTTVDIVEEFMGVTLVEISVKVDNLLIAKGKMKTVIAK